MPPLGRWQCSESILLCATAGQIEDEFEDDWQSEGRRILANADFFRIEAIDQPRQHRYDTPQHLFSGTNPLVGNKTFRDRSIQASSAFDRRTARVIDLCMGAACRLPNIVAWASRP